MVALSTSLASSAPTGPALGGAARSIQCLDGDSFANALGRILDSGCTSNSLLSTAQNAAQPQPIRLAPPQAKAGTGKGKSSAEAAPAPVTNTVWGLVQVIISIPGLSAPYPGGLGSVGEQPVGAGQPLAPSTQPHHTPCAGICEVTAEQQFAGPASGLSNEMNGLSVEPPFSAKTIPATAVPTPSAGEKDLARALSQPEGASPSAKMPEPSSHEQAVIASSLTAPGVSDPTVIDPAASFLCADGTSSETGVNAPSVQDAIAPGPSAGSQAGPSLLKNSPKSETGPATPAVKAENTPPVEPAQPENLATSSKASPQTIVLPTFTGAGGADGRENLLPPTLHVAFTAPRQQPQPTALPAPVDEVAHSAIKAVMQVPEMTSSPGSTSQAESSSAPALAAGANTESGAPVKADGHVPDQQSHGSNASQPRMETRRPRTRPPGLPHSSGQVCL